MSTHAGPSQGQNRKPAPCRFHSQGHCRFGTKCKFSHDTLAVVQPRNPFSQLAQLEAQPRAEPPPTDELANAATSTDSTSDARPRPKRGDIPCRAWKAGTCTRGSKCWFGHDLDTQKPGTERAQKQDAPALPAPVPVSSVPDTPSTSQTTNPPHPTQSAAKAERARAQEAKAAAARERALVLAREDAARTMTELVLGSIVTFSAGLNVPSLITGFETSTLLVRNIPLTLREGDVRALFRGQGLDPERFHFDIKKSSGRKLEARIVTDNEAGLALAMGLDGVEFHDETLVVEVSATNSLEGMSASATQNSDILTISWRAPSIRYVAEYIDIPAANEKVRELDRAIHSGRRVRVEMNSPPPGRVIRGFVQNSIKISNLPYSITDLEVMAFTGSSSLRRLPIGGRTGVQYTIEEITNMVRGDIQRAVPGTLKSFDAPPSTCNMEGFVSARAHFSSWDEARAAYTALTDNRYGTQSLCLRLPDPMQFTIFIPPEQYKSQRTQWDDLLGSIKDRKACMLNIYDNGNVVRIRLSGAVKEATGALKVRVENLVRGEKVEGWHRDLAMSDNPFFRRVHSETGAFLRSDWKRQTLKVYGAPRAVDQARELIKSELERLASMDYTITIPRYSVGFFMREGIQQLKDTVGDDNVRYSAPSRRITVSGGEEARHALDRLLTLSHNGGHGLPDHDHDTTSQGEHTCPICYDTVASPHQLGCGHTYCVACLRHFISSALESDQFPLTCLGDEARCRVPIPIPTIQHFLPKASFNRLLEAAFDTYIAKHPEEFKFCKTPDCTQIYRAVKPGQTPRSLQCPSCFAAVCNGCHDDAHEGMSCEQRVARRALVEAERLSDAWIASQSGRVKKCPRCGVLIEKTEGCNHMKCRCGAHICWQCMGIFEEGVIYGHMQSVHGTIHGNEPQAVAPEPVNLGFEVDIEEQRELFRQLELGRLANAAVPQNEGYMAQLARQRQQEQDRLREQRQRAETAERERRLRETQEWRERLMGVAQRQQEAEQRERLLRAERERHERERQERLRLLRQRELQEQARRERAARERREQERSGWGCMIM